jgi:hypothetical protein
MKKCLLLALLLPAAALAEPRVAITVSPVHLVVPVGELTAEVRVADNVGIAVIAGVGSVKVDMVADPVIVVEGGVSARYYATGSFRKGLQLGAEALYLHANTTGDSMARVRAEGLGLAPFAGYKWTGASGLTLEGQLGVTYLVMRAASETDEEEDSRVGAMVNLSIGYSF